MHTYVLMGQGGRLTSPGIASLSERIRREVPNTTVSLHTWDDPTVVSKINSLQGIKTSIVGYSLGANQLGFISDHAAAPLSLGIAYDPSRYSPLVNAAGVQTAHNFKRLICYRNTGAWFFGGSRYIGANVEEYNVNTLHFTIQFNSALHDKTITALRDVAYAR
jgi:predicted alpha/beta-fold hydrolase